MRIKYWNKGGDVKKYTQPIIIPFILRANKHIFQYPIPIWIESCKDPCPMIHKISLVLNILCKEHTTNQFPRQIGTNSVTGTKLFQPLFVIVSTVSPQSGGRHLFTGKLVSM